MLKLHRIGIHTYGENVAFLSAHCRTYKPEGFKTLNKVEIEGRDKAGLPRRIMASLNIVENGELLHPDNLGLSISAFNDLALPDGSPVTLKLAKPPESLESVRRKIAGEPLSAAEIMAIVSDIAAHRYSKTEIAAFLVACSSSLTHEELLAITTAMASVGTRLVWNRPPCEFSMVMDKHCIGGIPGNRTSMIVVPIVAACGMPIPKTSSRAITSPAGTADTMEVLANVDVSTEQMMDIVAKHGGCLVWGGHVNLSPADDIMITVERPLGIDTPEQMVASILSKKAAAGATNLVVDMPVGPSAKVRNAREAARLRKLFERLGAALGIHVDVVVTDGRQPVGRGVGPMLEARDVMAVLRNEPGAPTDLRERALLLAGHLLEMDPAARGGEGFVKARRALESGQALAQMERIMRAQGPAPEAYRMGELVRDIMAPRDGTVLEIDCLRIARIARLAGAPGAKGAGIDLLCKCGDTVKAGDPIYRIYSTVETDFGFATALAAESSGYTIQ